MSEPRGEEFREPVRRGLAPAELKALAQLSTARGLLALAQTAALAAAAVAAALVTRGRPLHALVVAAAILGVAGAQHQLAVLAHEAAHYRLLPSRRLNDFFGRLCAAPLGISMLTYTDQPGVQLYTGNFLVGDLQGTSGHTYRQTDAFTLETQHYPDSPNHIGQAGWPSVVLNAGSTFTSTTSYQFSTAGHGHDHYARR